MKAERELKVLTVEGRASAGLGQYAQHTCCGAHANAHLFPIFSFREGEEGKRGRQGEEEDWMQLKGVALRANRLIKKGEVVSIKYVGSGRTGHFQKVFDCACCWCTGRCNRGAHRTEQVWFNAIDQMEEKQPAKALKDLERQVMADKTNLQGLRRAHPGTLARTRPGGKIATQNATLWQGSDAKILLEDLRNIGEMSGWLSGTVINELLAWMRYGKTGEFGLSPHQREGVVIWSTLEWATLSREVDRLESSRDAISWQSFKTGIREQSAFRLPEGQDTRVVCCPVHYKSHWLWALLLLKEKTAIILDPLTSHTGRAGHLMIVKRLWYWREAAVVNGALPRPPPPLVASLEGNRRSKVVDVLEMGGWGSSTGSQQEAWLSNVWEVPQQPDGSACGIYLLATAAALTRRWSVQDVTDSERHWVRKARAWFLKVALANTARPPLGPCARCGGVDLYRATRAGARMCLACTS